MMTAAQTRTISQLNSTVGVVYSMPCASGDVIVKTGTFATYLIAPNGRVRVPDWEPLPAA